MDLPRPYTIPNAGSADTESSNGCKARSNRFTRGNASAKIATPMISAAGAFVGSGSNPPAVE